MVQLRASKEEPIAFCFLMCIHSTDRCCTISINAATKCMSATYVRHDQNSPLVVAVLRGQDCATIQAALAQITRQVREEGGGADT